MNGTSEDLAMSPSSSSLTSTSSTSSVLSPSLPSYKYKRPNLGEMAEAPDLKKVHVLGSQSVDWEFWRPKPASITTDTTSSANTAADQEVYEDYSQPQPSSSAAAALQGRATNYEMCHN